MAYEFNQAPKEWNAQSAAFRKQWKTLNDWIVWLKSQGRLIVQPKYDGVHVQLYTGDASGSVEPYALSRQAEPLPSMKRHALSARDYFGPDRLIYGEAWQQGTPHKEINGAVRRKSEAFQGSVYVYDWTTYSDSAGEVHPAQLGYRQRFDYLRSWLPQDYSPAWNGIRHALYVVDDLTRMIPREDDPLAGSRALLKSPDMYVPGSEFDGLIIRDGRAVLSMGASKQGEVIKAKESLSLDLRIVKSYAEHRATKLGGYLTVEYNGVLSDAGSGLTQKQLGEIMAHEDRFVGQIAEIECTGLTPAGKLREPRVKGIRWDTVREEDKE